MDDVQRVLASAHDDDAAHHVSLAVEVGYATAHLGTERHLRHVLDQHGRAAVGTEHDVFDVVNVLHVAAAAHHVLTARQLDEAPADVVVATANRRDDGLEGKPIGREQVRVHRDLVLPHLAAHGRHLGDTRNALHGVAQEPILV
jgi:hypothetical protein